MIGIYKITSPSGKIYIGQSIFIEARISKYRTAKCKSQNKLYNSILKYGWDNHQFKVIHELPKEATRDLLDEYERLYLDLYTQCGVSLLNIRAGGYTGRLNQSSILKMSEARKGEKNGMFGKTHTKEVRERISAMLIGKMAGNKNPMFGKTGELAPGYGKGIKSEQNKNYGKKHTKASIEKMIEAQNRIKRIGECHPLYGIKFSDDHKEKIKNGLKGRSVYFNRKVIQLTRDFLVIDTFDSIILASRTLKIQSSDINKCCNGVIKSAGGFIWKYKEQAA